MVYQKSNPPAAVTVTEDALSVETYNYSFNYLNPDGIGQLNFENDQEIT